MACFQHFILMLVFIFLPIVTDYTLADDSDVTIDIMQGNMTAKDKSVIISCMSNTNHRVKEILKLGVFKNNKEKMIKYLSEGSILSSNSLPDRFQVKGFMAADGSRASLNLTISTPKDEDVGMYTCSMIYKNGLDNLDIKDTSKNLTLNYLPSAVAVEDLLDRLNKLEKLNKDQTLQLAAIKQREATRKSIANELRNQVTALRTNQTFLKKQMDTEEASEQEGNKQLRDQVALLEAKNRNLSTQLTRKQNKESAEDDVIKTLVRQLATLEGLDRDQSMQIQTLTNGVKSEEGTNERLTAVVNNLELRNENISNTLDRISKKDIVNVAFSAMFEKSDMTLGNEETISFPNLRSDFGNNYNNRTSLFTAPLAGLYNFLTMVFIQCEPTSFLPYDIRLSDAPNGHSVVASYDGLGTRTTLMILKAGDKVKVSVNGDSSGTFEKCKGRGKFTGYLVSSAISD